MDDKETKDYRALAKQLIIAGYSPIPVSPSKNPAILSWMEFQDRAMNEFEIEKNFKNCWGIGFVCGKYSKTVAIDWDVKYFLNSNLYEDIKKELPEELLKKMYVQSTTSGGWHWIFKVNTSVIKGNQKLALRHSTAHEKDLTYREAYKNIRTRDNALKIAQKDACRVLVESREHGGYVVFAPSPGYKHVYGKIQEISISEYELLIDTIRKFNEYLTEDTIHKVYDNNEWTVSPFEDYCQNGDILGLLLEHGWEEVYTRNNSVKLKRPGSPHSKDSALLDMDTNIFNCFSTSTIFDTGKGYNGAGVFNILEGDEDWSKTFKLLVELGYGKK